MKKRRKYSRILYIPNIFQLKKTSNNQVDVLVKVIQFFKITVPPGIVIADSIFCVLTGCTCNVVMSFDVLVSPTMKAADSEVLL